MEQFLKVFLHLLKPVQGFYFKVPAPQVLFGEPAQAAEGPGIDLLASIFKVIIYDRGSGSGYLSGELHEKTGFPRLWLSAHDIYAPNTIEGPVHFIKTCLYSEQALTFFPFHELKKTEALFLRGWDR